MITAPRLLPATLAVAIVAAVAATAPSRAADDAAIDRERQAILARATAFAAAFEKGDAETLASFWTPEGDYVDLNGRRLHGRDAIAADFRSLFAENTGLRLRIDVGSIRFPAADVAIEDGVTSVLGPKGGLPSRARYTNTLVKRDGTWQLSSVRESAYQPPSNYHHLRSLEWMIGDWGQDVPEGAEATGSPLALVSFAWDPERNFILVTRGLVVNGTLLDNGTERIGWDPAARLVRTWTFEPDGGFGEGAWTGSGDTWTATMSSVLASGSLMTSTTIVKRIDADTITWQATRRVVDGQALPDTPVVTMRRIG